MNGDNTTDRTDSAPYRVLARKYRPQRFEDLIGQEPMVRTLRNAFETGRIAQAFLLTGVRGVGKTTTARILARALNYSRPGVDRPSLDFSELGEHCAAIMEGRHIDVIEMDAASHTGIGDVREIIEAVRYKPALARYKVYIIDEVHMLSNQAFNGLLKTLEEPPEHVKFLFATTEIRKVPVTVLSRCQRFDLRRIESDRLIELLTDITAKEGVSVEPEALALVARAAEGSARDALSLLDQAIAHTGGREGTPVSADTIRTMLGLADRARVIDLFEAAMNGNAPQALATLADLYAAGADPLLVLQDLANLTHLVTRLKLVPGAAEDPSLTEEERKRGQALGEGFSLRALTRCWQILLKGIEEVGIAARPLAAADMVLVRIAHVADLPTPDEAVRMLTERAYVPAGSSDLQAPRLGGRSQVEASRPAGPRLELAVSRAAAVARAPQPENGSEAVVEEPAIAIKSFEELPALAAAKRDLRLKFALERQVRLIRFRPPRIELALTEDAPTGLTGELAARLGEWTGRRWIITIGNGDAAPTLHQQQQGVRERLESDARSDPVVAAVLEHFPGAQIVDVRVRPKNADDFTADTAPAPDIDDSE